MPPLRWPTTSRASARCRRRRVICRWSRWRSAAGSTDCSPGSPVRQTFVNAFDEPLEATYIFPLPDRAAVTRFRMEVAGRVIEGILEERGQAREHYDQAIAAGPSRGDRRGGTARRLQPPRRQPDARRARDRRADPRAASCRTPTARSRSASRWWSRRDISPAALAGAIGRRRHRRGYGRRPRRLADQPAGPAAGLSEPGATEPGGGDARRRGRCSSEVRSSLHAVREESRDGYRRIRLQPGERLNRDFILRFRLGGPAIRSTLTLHPDRRRPRRDLRADDRAAREPSAGPCAAPRCGLRARPLGQHGGLEDGRGPARRWRG